MRGRVSLLGALLGLQLVVIAAVLFVESGFGDAQPGPFLDFEAEAVDEVRITAPDDGEALLARSDDGWWLADGLPADAGKVTELLERLAGLDAPWPVATSAGARERFEVAEESHQRHVVLKADGATVADVYLGTSPGYQQVHARRADGDAVFSVGLSNYQVPAKAADWLDKTLLQARGEVSAVTRDGAWQLTRGEEGWLVDGVAADQEAAGRLAERLAELRVTGATEAPAEGSEPAAVFHVSDGEGAYTLTLHGAGEGQAYTVASERRDGHFELAAYVAEQLLVERAALLPEEEEAPAAAEGSADVEDVDSPEPAGSGT